MPKPGSELRVSRSAFLPLVASSLLLASSLLGGDILGGASWTNLGKIPHDVSYTVVFRDGTCAEGRIRRVLADSLILTHANKGTNTLASSVTVARSEVLQVKDGRNQFDILYSGRSSWSDVRSIPTYTREHPIVTLKSGKSVSGRMVSSTESGISVRPTDAVESVAKEEIASVEYYRIKPAPGSVANPPTELPEELVYLLFKPAAWPYLFHAANMTVPLYDSALPEDDSIVECVTLR